MKRLILLILSVVFLTSFTSNNKSMDFYIVSKPGIIVNSHSNIVYICQGGQEAGIDRYVYQVSLAKGVYSYLNMDKSDTISFAIDVNGAYKMGFQEDHGTLSIFKKDPFESN